MDMTGRFGAELPVLFNFCILFAAMFVVIMDLLYICSMSSKVAAICGSCLYVAVAVDAFEPT
jgi:hypothetical protein